MSFSVYSSIGSSFGKLFKSKPKPIFIANTVSTVSIPFLHGFKSGSTSLKALEDGVIEEITEDIFETKYTLTLDQRGVVYSVLIGETKDGWFIKEVRKISGGSRQDSPPTAASGKKKSMTLSFFVLILISVAGYAYEFGFNKDSDGDSSANQSVFEAFSSQPASSSNPTNIEEKSEDVKAPDPVETEKAQWEKERTALEHKVVAMEQKVAALQKENDALKKQLTEGVVFVIQPGAKPADIAQAAQLAGIVKSAEEFNQAILAAQAGDHIVPGTYRLIPGTSYEEMLEIITKGIVKK